MAYFNKSFLNKEKNVDSGTVNWNIIIKIVVKVLNFMNTIKSVIDLIGQTIKP